jgi:HlyD family secretion protein
VHGTAALLVLLLAAAIAWSAMGEAALVVQAAGRVRPLEQPARVYAPTTAELDGRVTAVNFDEGALVKKGQVLLKLETERLENRIAKLMRSIEAAEEELVELDRVDALLLEQLASAKAKAAAELKSAQDKLRRAKDQQRSQVREAESAFAAAKDELRRYRAVFRQGAVTEERLVETAAKVRQAEEKLKQVELPLEEGHIQVLRQEQQLIERDFAVRRAEVDANKVVKRGEVAAARREFANLELALKQSVIYAPIDGVVVTGQLKVGDIVEPGKPIAEIAQENLRFEAVVSGGDVGDLRVGMPVRVKFDAYDYQDYGTLAGTVSYIAPDSQVAKQTDSAEAPTAPLAYLVRITLADDEVGRGDNRGKIKLGLGGVAEIVTGHESLLSILVKKVRHKISLG